MTAEDRVTGGQALMTEGHTSCVGQTLMTGRRVFMPQRRVFMTERQVFMTEGHVSGCKYAAPPPKKPLGKRPGND
ncbi:MAG: hypothetical protein WC670_02090 [Pseudolabrys sp.]|jgi:hypothetical protein